MTTDVVALLVVALMKSSGTIAVNEAHQRLAAMPEEERKEAIARQMRRTGESCNVSRTWFRVFDAQGTAYWNVACANAETYLVGIRNGAPASILSCGASKTVTGVDCSGSFRWEK